MRNTAPRCAVSALADPCAGRGMSTTACHSDKPPHLLNPKSRKERQIQRRARRRTGFSHFKGGSKLEMNPMRVPIPPDNAGGKRKKISSMSPKAMRALKRKCAEVDKHAEAWTCALTYGENYPKADISKDQLQKLQRWVNRHFPDIGGFWKREPQKRGATHFHLLLFIDDEAKAKLAINAICVKWCEIANDSYGGDQFAKALKVHTHDSNCQKMVGKSFFSYLAKYLSKGSESMPDDYILECGRGWWGKVNEKAIPFVENVEEELDQKKVSLEKSKQVERACYKYRHHVANKAVERATSELSKNGRLSHSFNFHSQMIGRLLQKSFKESPRKARKRERKILDPEGRFKKARKLTRSGKIVITSVYVDEIKESLDRFIFDSVDLDARSNIFGDSWTPPVSLFENVGEDRTTPSEDTEATSPV